MDTYSLVIRARPGGPRLGPGPAESGEGTRPGGRRPGRIKLEKARAQPESLTVSLSAALASLSEPQAASHGASEFAKCV